MQRHKRRLTDLIAIMFHKYLVPLLLLFLSTVQGSATILPWVASQSSSSELPSAIETENAAFPIGEAVKLLISAGVPRANFCRVPQHHDYYSRELAWILPYCSGSHLAAIESSGSTSSSNSTRWIRSRRQRYLAEDEKFLGNQWFYITNAAFSLLCVITAALAAGLTMGLLSLDPLMLLIKVRAGATQEEQDQAAALLPIIKQHHLLLVTLLLLNSMANEALPLFLEQLVSPVVAVILSVTLVLFFGEIVPSAVFTGPNKVALAYRMVPLVKFVMAVLWPLSFPIAKLLDHVLHDETSESPDAFGRGELSALVRIQYEERMAHKKRIKAGKAAMATKTATQQNSDLVDNVGALDFASTQAIKASKKTVDRRSTTNSIQPGPSRLGSSDDDPSLTPQTQRTVSIHIDEVSMVEGALSMKTKVALDVYTPVHRMMAIPYDMLLTENNMVSLYARGFSRIPVYQPNPKKPKDHTAIVGVLMTKRLIVVDSKEERPLSTLPLSSPRCVSPKMNLVDLLNLFQTGTLGHLALVCARPVKGQMALDNGEPLPEKAGLMGIITLEDVLEALLQEQIYDESDNYEREGLRLSKWVAQKWKAYARRKKRERRMALETVRHISMGTLVEQVMDANERTGLLDGSSSSDSNSGFLSPIQGVKEFFDKLPWNQS